MDCNLGCYYCYEEKYPSRMSLATCDRIYDYIVSDLSTRNQKRMHLGWFGGEPMLNRDAIDYLSARLWPYCKTATSDIRFPWSPTEPSGLPILRNVVILSCEIKLGASSSVSTDLPRITIIGGTL